MMLVLTRQKNQSIMIGDEIEIVVVDIRGDKVRIGINAPNSIPVHRQEVYEAIKAANVEAASAGLDEAARAARLLQSRSEKTDDDKPPTDDKGHPSGDKEV